MEQLVLADPAVSSVVRLTGIDPNGFSPIAVREGKLRIRLRPETERARQFLQRYAGDIANNKR